MEEFDLEVFAREYRKGDEYGIVDLFRISSDHLRTKSFFKWANIKNPFSKSISLVLQDSNESIIGHYALMIFRLVYKDEIFNAGFGSQLVIHPKFRNFKFMWKLLNVVWDSSKEKGLRFLYAFPNNNIWPVKNRLMGWELIKEFQPLEVDIRGKDVISGNNSELRFQRICTLTNYKELINKIWDVSKDMYKDLIHIERSYDFVQWRFFQHPLEHYPFYLIKNQNGIIIGWIAFKFYRKNGILYGHIVDFVIPDEKLEDALIRQAIKYFAWCGVDIISTWSSKIIKRKYEEVGFRENGFVTNFGIRYLDEAWKERVDITDYTKWDLNMSYSDAF